MSENLKPTVVAKYQFLHEAHVAKSYLESQGLTCFLYHDNMFVYNQALGGVRLACPEEELARARELLAEVERQQIGVVPEESSFPSGAEERGQEARGQSSSVSPLTRWGILIFLLLILLQIFYMVQDS